jgi:sucrose-6-phosphate hydrolase SacC (GH32 family)
VAFDLRGVPLRYDAATQELTIARHKAAWPAKDGKLGLVVYVDRTCVEVFSQDGLHYASVAVIPEEAVKRVSVTVEKGAVKALRGEAYELRSVWK